MPRLVLDFPYGGNYLFCNALLGQGGFQRLF
jgi:hypothetical protein